MGSRPVNGKAETAGVMAPVVLAAGLLALVFVLERNPAARPAVERPVPAEQETPNPRNTPESAMKATAVRLPAPPPPKEAPAAPPRVQRRPLAASTPTPVTPLKPRPEQPVRAPATTFTPLKATPQPQPNPVQREMPERPQISIERDPAPTEVSLQTDSPEAVEGRALLKLLEHGEGPDIVINWPDSSRQRRVLHDRLKSCFGMTLALMDGRGALYRPAERPGQAWAINMDRYSGFVRQPQGFLGKEETDRARAIRRHHRLRGNAVPVRLFGRRADAALLGGLSRVLGEDFKNAGRVRGAYRVTPSHILVENLFRDGRPVSGRVAIPARAGRCRGAS